MFLPANTNLNKMQEEEVVDHSVMGKRKMLEIKSCEISKNYFQY